MQQKIFSILFFVLFHLVAQAQFLSHLAVEPSFHVGKIVKHSPKLLFDVTGVSTGMDLNFTFKKTGKKHWAQELNYPVIGLDLVYYHLGDKDLFGQAFGIAPNLSLRIYKSKRLEGFFQIGWGVAYVTKKFDPIDNPTGNALGSNINSLNIFKFLLDHQLTKNWKIRGGFSFTHYSNGATQLPNFGINIPALTVGAIFNPKPVKAEDLTAREKQVGVKKWGLSAYFAMTYKELNPANGPRYPFYIASLAGTRRLTALHELSVGANYEYSTSAYLIGLHTFTFNSEAEARRKSTRIGIFIADELYLDNVGLWLEMGTYVPGYDYDVPWFLYTKVGVKYHFPPIKIINTGCYIGIYLKSHKIAAEYFSLGIGLKI